MQFLVTLVDFQVLQQQTKTVFLIFLEATLCTNSFVRAVIQNISAKLLDVFLHDSLNMANLTLILITYNSSSSIFQHLSQCEHAKFIINMHNLYSNLHDGFQKQHIPSSYTKTNLIFNHTKILHSADHIVLTFYSTLKHYISNTIILN